MSKLILVASKENKMVTVESTEYNNKMAFEKQARLDGYQVVCVLNEQNIKNIINGEGKLTAILEKRNKKAVPFIREVFANQKTLSDYVAELIESGYVSTTSKEIYQDIKESAKELLEGTESKLKFRYNVGKKIYEVKIV